MAYLSQFLATIKTDVDFNFDFENTCLEIEKKGDVIEFFSKVQFFSFVKNIDNLLVPLLCKDEPKKPIETIDAAPKPEKSSPVETQKNENTQKQEIAEYSTGPIQGSLFNTVQKSVNNTINLATVDFQEFQKNIKNDNPVAFLMENNTVYFADDKNMTSAALKDAKEFLCDENIKKITHDIKKALEYNLEINGITDDIMLSSYVKDSSRKHDLISQIQNYLNVIPNEENKNELTGYIYKLHNYYQKKLTEKFQTLKKISMKKQAPFLI